MESHPERSASNGSPAERQLPPGGGRVERITQHTQGLVDDLKTWVELRVKLAKIEALQRLEERANDIAIKVIMGVLGALAGLMGLFMLSFLFAWLWSFTGAGTLASAMLGFLTTAVLLALLAVIVNAAQPQLVPITEEVKVDETKVKRGSSPLGDRSASSSRL